MVVERERGGGRGGGGCACEWEREREREEEGVCKIEGVCVWGGGGCVFLGGVGWVGRLNRKDKQRVCKRKILFNLPWLT